MTPTLQQWLDLGLRPAEYVPWTLAPLAQQATAKAERSPVMGEGWLITYENPRSTFILIGEGLRPQQARDAASFLRGGIKKT